MTKTMTITEILTFSFSAAQQFYLLTTLSLSFACDGFQEREGPEDDGWLGWTLKVQDESFPGQRSLQIGD
jgi:hypothetical protein